MLDDVLRLRRIDPAKGGGRKDTVNFLLLLQKIVEYQQREAELSPLLGRARRREDESSERQSTEPWILGKNGWINGEEKRKKSFGCDWSTMFSGCEVL